MLAQIRSFKLGGWFALATLMAVAVGLTSSNALANKNPATCNKVSAGLLLGELRDTPRCRGGANNFSNCAGDSECPGGTCAPGGTCGGGPNIAQPCTTDTDCPPGVDGGTCVLGDTTIETPKVVGETIYYQASLGFNATPGSCGYEAGRVCIDLPGAGCPVGFDAVPRLCVSGAAATLGNPCTVAADCGVGGVCLPADCCEVTPSRFCIGGGDDGTPCNIPAECESGVCGRQCVGGASDGNACTVDENCAPPGACTGGIPLVCPSVFGCAPNPSSGTGGLLSQGAREIPYVVSFADAVGGKVTAQSIYLIGRSHFDVDDENATDIRSVENAIATATPTATATATATPTVTPTTTVTPTETTTPTPTATPTTTVTKTPTATPTKAGTKTPTPTATKVATPTKTKATKTATPTATKVATPTKTKSTPTPTPTKGATPTKTKSTATATKVGTPTKTKATKTPTPTVTPHKDKEVCRNSYYWKVYGGTSKYKSCSQNITQSVLDARGSVAICGEIIKTTSLDDAASAVEAMCSDAPSGSKRLLVRELTAAALNCIVSDLASGRDPKANPLCGSVSTAALFANCNALCAGSGGSGTVSQCIEALKCVNGGDDWTGSYCKDDDYGCDDVKLPSCTVLSLPNCRLSLRDDCYAEHGQAGGSNKCDQAKDNACEVLGDGEAKCACDSDPLANENPHCP